MVYTKKIGGVASGATEALYEALLSENVLRSHLMIRFSILCLCDMPGAAPNAE